MVFGIKKIREKDILDLKPKKSAGEILKENIEPRKKKVPTLDALVEKGFKGTKKNSIMKF